MLVCNYSFWMECQSIVGHPSAICQISLTLWRYPFHFTSGWRKTRNDPAKARTRTPRFEIPRANHQVLEHFLITSYQLRNDDE